VKGTDGRKGGEDQKRMMGLGRLYVTNESLIINSLVFIKRASME